MSEEWLPVPNYEGAYEVSNIGRVRSIDRIVPNGPRQQMVARGKVVTPVTDSKGRLLIALWSQNRVRRFLVHRLVLEAFVGPPQPGQICCHNDGNPQNNTLSNLRWDTYSANSRDAVRHGTHGSARRTHCKYGHPFSGENLMTYRLHGEVRRTCRACRKARRARSTKAGRARARELFEQTRREKEQAK